VWVTGVRHHGVDPSSCGIEFSLRYTEDTGGVVRRWWVSWVVWFGVLGCGLGSEAKIEKLNSTAADTGTGSTTEEADSSEPADDTGSTEPPVDPDPEPDPEPDPDPDVDSDSGDPGSIDTGTEDPGPEPPCDVDISIEFPAGEVITPSFCGRVGVIATMESTAEGMAELRTPVLELYDTTSSYNECFIRINMPSLCGPGHYRMHGEYGNNVALTARGCEGAPEDYALWFVSGWGYVRIDEATVSPSSESDDSGLHTVRFGGGLNVYAPLPPDPEGPAISGTFFVRTEMALDLAGETECTLIDADEDEDGWLSDEFDGGDCDDHQADTFPGAAEHDSDSACMVDSDGDGFGSETPGGVGVNPGTDCDDGDATRHPGATEVDGDGVDSDCNGVDG